MSVLSRPSGNYDGWLDWLADYLSYIKDEINDLYWSIEGVWLLDEYLQPSLNYFYWQFDGAEKSVRNAGWWLEFSVEFAENWLDDFYVWEYLDWLGDEIKDLRDNPISYLQVTIASMGIDYMYLMYYPIDFVKVQLYKIDDSFYQLINYPDQFIYDLLYAYNIDLYGFLDNPIDWARRMIAGISYDYLYLMYYPIDWVKLKLYEVDDNFYQLINYPDQFIYDLMNSFNNELGLFMIDPVNWLQNYLSDLLGLPYGFWEDPGQYFLDLILYTLELLFDYYVERLKDLLIRLLLRFI